MPTYKKTSNFYENEYQDIDMDDLDEYYYDRYDYDDDFTSGVGLYYFTDDCIVDIAKF